MIILLDGAAVIILLDVLPKIRVSTYAHMGTILQLAKLPELT